MTTSIRIKDLKFSYQSQKNNLSPLVLSIDELEIKTSEKVFLYGPSGYGKSTLLNILAGVLEVKSGNVEVLGKNLHDISQGARDHLRGENIGYIFQIFNLIPYLNIKENIVLPCLINKKRGEGIDFYAQADELIKTLGLVDHAQKNVTDLSIGQQQRVAAARALIGNPKLIIADEPTSSLDEKNTAEFMNLLINEWEKRKFTLIFVSHDTRLKDYFPKTISLPEINKI
ncbi:MAG: ABC transporter ATP-binding protein [Alphaproteobacteria bacterium]|nr:MAG: ABC transporter ATP-binding protein [Alphaproteobacteria bacterium]